MVTSRSAEEVKFLLCRFPRGSKSIGLRVLGLRVLGFRVLGFRVLGFRVLGFRVLGFRVLGFRVWGFRVHYPLKSRNRTYIWLFGALGCARPVANTRVFPQAL